MTADHSFCIRHRAAIYGAELPEVVVITDLEKCRLADVFEVLAALANGAIGKEVIVLPDFGGAGDGDVVGEDRARADAMTALTLRWYSTASWKPRQ